MKHLRPAMFASALLATSSAALAAHAQGVPARRVPLEQMVPARTPAGASADARDGVVIGTGVRSIHVLRAGEVIRQRPEASAPRRGTAARDAYLPALEATLGPGCRTRFYRVGRDAWMCGDDVELSSAAPHAQSEPSVAEGALTPHEYAFAAFSGVATYRSLEDTEGEDWAEQLERGMGVAIDGRARRDGRMYVHTAGNRWIAQSDLTFARASALAGTTYEPNEALTSVGFARARTHTFATAEDAASGVRGNVRPRAFLVQRAGAHIREEQLVRGRRVVRTDAGWVLASALIVPDVPAPPALATPSERWVDVDIGRQLLVAFEGARPVYATLVSSGRADHPTHPGTFRVWIRMASTDMSNADNAQLDADARIYSVERVPWVMYFNGDQALHGAYWHDRFGTRRSHGCVNLAPTDARWLFGWAPPAMPPGWNAVFPTRDEPGLQVRVR